MEVEAYEYKFFHHLICWKNILASKLPYHKEKNITTETYVG